MTYSETKNELKKRGLLNILKCLKENDIDNQHEGIDCYCLKCNDSLETKTNGETASFCFSEVFSFGCGDKYYSIVIDTEFLSPDGMDDFQLRELDSVCEKIYNDYPIDDCYFAMEKADMIHGIMNNYDIDYDNTAVYDYLNCDCEYDSENIYYDSDRLLNDIVYRR